MSCLCALAPMATRWTRGKGWRRTIKGRIGREGVQQQSLPGVERKDSVAWVDFFMRCFPTVLSPSCPTSLLVARGKRAWIARSACIAVCQSLMGPTSTPRQSQFHHHPQKTKIKSKSKIKKLLVKHGCCIHRQTKGTRPSIPPLHPQNRKHRPTHP